MSGSSFFLDTSIVLRFLQGDSRVKFLEKPGTSIFISIITILEFQCNTALGAADMHLFNGFTSLHHIVDLTADNKALQKTIVSIRKKYKLKLPDAVIAASAIHTSSVLVTADADFKNIYGLTTRIL